ncbi:hypothetical protein M3Y94_01307300 [Aphelenchoides besseyi]|nr:hypothetical protein M3Y94_01307300 [Aphelenchoides besseyi]
MSTAWSSLFTPIDQMPPVERSVVSAEEVWGVDPDEMQEKNVTRVCNADNPSALLEMSYKWSYGKSPVVVEETIGRRGPFEYVCKIKIGGYKEQTAKANNKTVAKHLAAEKVLYEIIENGEHKAFSLPGETKEEARKYIASLDSGVKKEKPNDNWIGKCTQCCAQKGIRLQPQYEFEAPSGPPHQRTFRCHAILLEPQHECEGTGKSKSEAKGEAAKKMFEFLQSLPTNPKPAKPERLDEISFFVKELCDKVAELDSQDDNGEKST